MSIRLFPLLLSLLGTAVQAAPQADPATLQTLAEDPYWISLGHYEQQTFGGWQSYVDDADFFLAVDGERAPLAELQATLQALYADPELADAHPQCRFPSRTRWLRQQLPLEDLPIVECAEFAAWYADIDPHTTVLVFPDAYLNSPSSMFGHTLLRIDSAANEGSGTALLSYALNFGAMVEGMDNSILYAWKGLAGGYPGQFALLPYREKLSEYSSLENRDLWEYRLDLTPEETGRMIEHVWELRQIRFDYFFFDENCSYRLLELLEIARPGLKLIDQFPLTAIPADTVRAVKDAGLVQDINYRPSREKELLARAAPLQPKEVSWAQALAADTGLLEDAAFQTLPAERQALIQETAYRLLRYQAAGQERDAGNAARSFRMLQAINQNPPPRLEIATPTLPEDGHESRTWQLALGSQDHRSFAEYGLRMAYHDLNDNLAGFPLGAQIELGKLRVRQYEGNHWQLEELGLVSIRSLTPRNQLLKPWSWQVETGLERVAGKDGKQRLVGHLNGGGGATWTLTENVLGYALMTLRVEHHQDFAAILSPAAGFDSGLLRRNRAGNLLLEAQADYFHNGEVRHSLGLTQQLELGRNLGLRLTAQREFSQWSAPQNEVMLQLRWYHY
ncbi:DUF4105 domain-containing protein [Halopseudomonas bauzanensis]|uniref:DUF4105 domain-containing protein n=1 Tax=Halopseudomonas bauzanensis TaxID=653930 RepID=A0A4U0YLP0_9GAMM|nr:DUF4105 domain-containing protein [Halopseudomonas bauzanensis]TKA93110.1 DUF4105 domain-containing protein [Halopseudomonas bauzanensis]